MALPPPCHRSCDSIKWLPTSTPYLVVPRNTEGKKVLISTFQLKHFIALIKLLNKATKKWLRLCQEENSKSPAFPPVQTTALGYSNFSLDNAGDYSGTEEQEIPMTTIYQMKPLKMMSTKKSLAIRQIQEDWPVKEWMT